MSQLNNQFTCIRTEGALLPPDILQRINSFKVEGIRPSDYHLPDGFKVNEAITQSWDMLKKHWKSFREATEQIPDSDTGTSVTNERWLLPLLKELDYGRLQTSEPIAIEEKTYPIRRFYNHTPIHLIGCNLPLDKRTKGAAGAATASPHSMVQEFLNRSDDHLWAILSNGRQLRILRDNIALSRQSFIEFDLEAMMDGEVYSDFALLWILCHQSRFEAKKQENCWLETWSKLAREEGTRVLNNLREGVANAIEALGEGFLAHPRNDDLRSKLQESGSLSKDDFYRQLLRIVYRMLFLFVAEDRQLLHPSDTDEKVKSLYRKYYSTARLREMSRKLRGSKHGDLWHSFSLVCSALGKNEGCSQLGLIGLGSFLWKTDSVSALLGPIEVGGDEIPAQIANDDFLAAIRALAYVEQDRILRTVDYRNLGSEELGSIYESLLELHPDIHVEARHFELRTAAGNERKTSGSYYTPDSLVQCLLDSALDPVVADRLKGKKGQEAEEALLSMKVCDPACGSGHFLIAAAHRIARHLARVRTGEMEPAPEDHQHALRDVIGRCIYGVDLNPMTVELCKVSLWIEAIEPGKPLSFLDSHIQCGNALLGTTPKLLADGIPDDAFKPIEGDEKEVAAALKRRNKAERRDRIQGQKSLFSTQDGGTSLASKFSELSELDDSTVDAVAKKEQVHANLVASNDYQDSLLIADTWCSAFVWKKDESEESKLCPTDQDFSELKENPSGASADLKSGVQSLCQRYQFFHWHLAFPDVFELPEELASAENQSTGWNAGFDLLLGNPPWERVKLQEKEWFSERVPEIASAPNAAARKKLIKALETEQPALWKAFLKDARLAEGVSHILRDSNAYPLCGRGDVNLYTVFAELFRNRLQPSGRFGAVLPSGIATDDTTKYYFQSLVETNSLISFYDFENRKGLFPDVDSRMKFCLLTAGSGIMPAADAADFAFFCHSTNELNEAGKCFSLSRDDIEQLNPNTRTCPIFRSTADAELTKAIYRRVPVLIREARDGQPEENPWGIKFSRMFDMANDSNLFRGDQNLMEDGYRLDKNVFRHEFESDYVPLYEGKMTNIYDHRSASVVISKTAMTRQGQKAELTEEEHASASELPLPRYWISTTHVDNRIAAPKQALLAFSDVTSATNERTMLARFIPRVGAGHKLPIIHCENTSIEPFLLANLTSFILDNQARQKLGGVSFTYFILKQLPVLKHNVYFKATVWETNSQLAKWILSRVLELTYTAWDLEAFAQDCGYDGLPFRWDEDRRFLLRCELDAAYFHLYLGLPSEWGNGSPALLEILPTPRDAVDYIMETFPIVKRKDIARTEVKDDKGDVITDGTYITKDTILSIYDEMQRAIDSGQPYQTRLDPPPGPPTDADGNFIPMAQWDETDWPSHIHPPRDEAKT